MSLAYSHRAHKQETSSIQSNKVIKYYVRFPFCDPFRKTRITASLRNQFGLAALGINPVFMRRHFNISGIVIRYCAVIIAWGYSRRLQKSLPMIRGLAATTLCALAGNDFHTGTKTERASSFRRSLRGRRSFIGARITLRIGYYSQVF